MFRYFQNVVRPVVRYAGKNTWNVAGLNHVAVVVPNIEAASAFYRDTFGVKVDEPTQAKEHGVTVAFVHFGNTKIELLSPLGEGSPVAKFLEKNKNGGLHHVCIEVDNLGEAIRGIKQKNLRFLAPEPKIGACGLPIIFMNPKDASGVLTELEETHSKEGH
ncbi:Methylmalonyl-CoA epimerase /ethylmalonyl-CoA epimerase [Fasciola hepatica]|uniref:Methylmalonyl-CoA epimerase, mitochondrial n=1 Tax=Fasciola hepatica TaxID=6192 RepID=A0A4E0R1H7_FASHE|nr:Methylmalonyl-CoA epimerase /ethylmalonyl-CoA epimerase [Fasciola hepatica]